MAIYPGLTLSLSRMKNTFQQQSFVLKVYNFCTLCFIASKLYFTKIFGIKYILVELFQFEAVIFNRCADTYLIVVRTLLNLVLELNASQVCKIIMRGCMFNLKSQTPQMPILELFACVISF